MLFSPVYIEAHPCRPPHFVSGLTSILYALLPNPFPCHTSRIAVCKSCVCHTSDAPPEAILSEQNPSGRLRSVSIPSLQLFCCWFNSAVAAASRRTPFLPHR